LLVKIQTGFRQKYPDSPKSSPTNLTSVARFTQLEFKVRSLERPRLPALSAQWLQKWRIFKDLPPVGICHYGLALHGESYLSNLATQWEWKQSSIVILVIISVGNS